MYGLGFSLGFRLGRVHRSIPPSAPSPSPFSLSFSPSNPCHPPLSHATHARTHTRTHTHHVRVPSFPQGRQHGVEQKRECRCRRLLLLRLGFRADATVGVCLTVLSDLCPSPLSISSLPPILCRGHLLYPLFPPPLPPFRSPHLCIDTCIHSNTQPDRGHRRPPREKHTGRGHPARSLLYHSTPSM